MEPLTFFQFLIGVGLLCVGLASDRFWWRFAFGLTTAFVALQIHVSGVDAVVKAPIQLLTLQTAQSGV